ncbi:MAG: twin-arginine translocation signal protein [Bacteroidetes bacterium]|nr:twin-arginine translocation signal protein [Bacteroidota bacterium]
MFNHPVGGSPMFNLKETVHRRGFLGSIAVGAATLGLASLPTSTNLLANPPGPKETEFEAALKKMKGRRHKQVFDAPMPNEGFSVLWSWAFLATNNGTGTPDKDLGVAVVFRHDAIPFAMEDRLWAKYKFGEAFKITDKATKAPSVRNVVTHIKPEDMPLPDMALELVQKRGVVFGVCDLALTVYSKHIAGEMKMDADEVKKDWVSGLLPGMVILPSGVWAVNRAQEYGFSYCYAG